MERNEPPRWMQDKHFNEVLFCEDFLSAHPMVCVDGSFFTVEGRVTDEEGIRKQIYEDAAPAFYERHGPPRHWSSRNAQAGSLHAGAAHSGGSDPCGERHVVSQRRVST